MPFKIPHGFLRKCFHISINSQSKKNWGPRVCYILLPVKSPLNKLWSCLALKWPIRRTSEITSVLVRVLQRNRIRCMFISFKELVQVIIMTGKSKVWRVGQQSQEETLLQFKSRSCQMGDPGKSPCCSAIWGPRLEECPLAQGRSAICLIHILNWL